MLPTSHRQVDIFDITGDEEELERLNALLRSTNVFDYEHHVGFTPMGECKIVMFYRIQDPKEDVPRDSLDDDGNP